MKICVVGTGYVGLVTGACFAELGNAVTCVDKVEEKIQALERGEIPIYEPGLDDVVHRNVQAGRLAFTTDLDTAIREALVVIIAVGTPQGDDGRADLSFVRAVAASIGKNLDSYKVVVTKSTVPAGTGKMVREVIEENLEDDVPFSVASNPEFLREGSAIEDFMRPNRVVLGTEDEQSAAILRDLYRPLYLIETPIVVTNVVTAEVVKYETTERRRLSMRPGLTCLWQVGGRNDVGFDEWVKLDLQYIDTWSIWNDCKILLLTVPAVLRGTGS